jgi:hypothetical protein
VRLTLIVAAIVAAPGPTIAPLPGKPGGDATAADRRIGVAMPRTLAGLKRVAVENGRPSLIAIYAAAGKTDPTKPSVTIAVGPAAGLPSEDEMRSSVRASVSGGKPVHAIAEGAFDWPGHPAARTFRGRYAGEDTDKEIWTTGDGRFGVLVMITAPAGNLRELDRLSGAVAREVFGGAKLRAQPRKSAD